MSTKIYHGCKVDLEVLPLLDLPGVLRDLLDPLARIKYLDIVVGSAVAEFDCMCRPEIPAVLSDHRGSLLSEAAHLVRTTVWSMSRSGQRSPIDFGFDVTILPYPGSTTVAFAVPFTETSAFREAWMSLPGVSEYGYWNNTDQADGVSDEEWDRRRDDWDLVLPGFAPPSRRGLTWSLLNSLGLPGNISLVDDVELAGFIPSEKVRALRTRDTLNRRGSDGPRFLADEVQAGLRPVSVELLGTPVKDLSWV